MLEGILERVWERFQLIINDTMGYNVGVIIGASIEHVEGSVGECWSERSVRERVGVSEVLEEVKCCKLAKICL